MAFVEDDRPRPERSHGIGDDITLLGVGELETRVAELKLEIARLEAELAAREGTRTAAEMLFKR